MFGEGLIFKITLGVVHLDQIVIYITT